MVIPQWDVEKLRASWKIATLAPWKIKLLWRNPNKLALIKGHPLIVSNVDNIRYSVIKHRWKIHHFDYFDGFPINAFVAIGDVPCLI